MLAHGRKARAALAESMVSLGIVIAHAKEKLRAAELLHADNDLLRQAVKLPIKEARERFERAYLEFQYEHHGGNVSAMAASIGMERSALHRKMRSLGIHRRTTPKRWRASDV
jgi:DNA-binding NtrC family response regulator